VASPVVRVAVIEQVGYREWTESLGSDREWRIQMVQSRVYREGQEAATEAGGFLLPLRYDIMLLLASGLDERGVRSVHEAVAAASEVPVRTASGCAPTPLEAVDRAWVALSQLPPGGFSFRECRGREETVAAHIDVNGITGLTRKLGPLRTYYMVLDTLASVRRAGEKMGAIVQYLGGDNLLAVLPPGGDPAAAAEALISGSADLKAGVGVSERARESLALAAEALHMIRSGAARERVVVIRGRGAAAGPI
jgi:GTP cyclohydrolase IIa